MFSENKNLKYFFQKLSVMGPDGRLRAHTLGNEALPLISSFRPVLDHKIQKNQMRDSPARADYTSLNITAAGAVDREFLSIFF